MIYQNLDGAGEVQSNSAPYSEMSRDWYANRLGSPRQNASRDSPVRARNRLMVWSRWLLSSSEAFFKMLTAVQCLLHAHPPSPIVFISRLLTSCNPTSLCTSAARPPAPSYITHHCPRSGEWQPYLITLISHHAQTTYACNPSAFAQKRRVAHGQAESKDMDVRVHETRHVTLRRLR